LLISTLHGAEMACHERILWNNEVSNVGLVNHVYYCRLITLLGVL
jgi:hypothetical protein